LVLPTDFLMGERAYSHRGLSIAAHKSFLVRARAEFLERADAARLVRYSDEEVANRDVRVWHGATENGP
jgi:hypothetical protein